MKKKLFKMIALVLTAAMLLCLLAACGDTTDVAEQPAADGKSETAQSSTGSKDTKTEQASTGGDEYVKVTIGLADALGVFVSGLTPSACVPACDAVLNTVFKADPITREYYSDILDDWYWEDDTHFVMKLKSGIYFSNGEEALPEDLLFAFTQHLDRGSSHGATLKLVQEGCVVRDDGSVVLEVTQKNSQIFEFLMYLYDKSWIESVGWDSEEMFTPVGSGPYYCAEYVYDDHITLKLRDEYWAEDISNFYVDEYEIRYYADSATMFMALEAGDIDLCEVDANDYSRYLSNGGDGYECIKISTGVNTLFVFGFEQNNIWNEYPELREAVALGVNWKELGVLVSGDLYSEVNSLAPKSGPYYYEAGVYEYNPEKAAEIVAGLGLSQEQLTLTTVLMESNQYKAFGEGIKYYLEKVGFTVEVTYGDLSSTLAAWQAEDSGTDFCMYTDIYGSATGDPIKNIQATNAKPGFTWSYITDDTYQELFKDLSTNFDLDIATKLEKFKALQDYTFENHLLIPFGEGMAVFGFRTDRFTEEMASKFLLTSSSIWLLDLGRASVWGK